MKKSLIITIMIDNVELKKLEELDTKIREVIAEYREKRINISIQDTRLLAVPTLE